VELGYDIRFRINANGCKCFGPGAARLIALAGEKNSLRAAAAEMGMAYSKAWRVVKACEEAMGIKLLQLRAGGRNGGGASLTPEGELLLKRYEAMTARLNELAGAELEEYFGFLRDAKA